MTEEVRIEKEIAAPEETEGEAQETQEEKPLTVDQAFQNVDVACSQFQGNRAQHQVIVKSLGLLNAVINEFKSMKMAEEAEK